jgi:endonuclease/exonuclease/phosphatase family metal-dependent hydrolase
MTNSILQLVRSLAAFAVGIHLAGALCAQKEDLPEEVKVMTWNIWHGGREDGEKIGPKRVIDVIEDSGADIVAMQETYGSGELIAKKLGFHFQPRGTNVSIHSRFALVEDISVHAKFQCVGALVELPDQSHLAFYSIWQPYSGEIWAEGTRDLSKPETMLAACKASHESLQTMWSAINKRLSAAKYDDVPIIIAGDFNSMSHIDYGEIGWDQYGAVINWPTSTVLTQAGFTDSYRSCNPLIDRAADSTWTPRFPKQDQDRIDFIYHRSARSRSSLVATTESVVIREHKKRFPSDHAALVSTLQVTQQDPKQENTAIPLQVVSYNIKHGRGMDGQVNLERTAEVLRKLNPDFVGLQEVDLQVARSGKTNQANELGAMLNMHPIFGSFMDYQGGRYGMAILSRHPVVRVNSLRLPNGNEPRVALIAEVRLPNDTTMLIVNVHFDWVDDDGFRFAQAKTLATHLQAQPHPYVLLGDFNDGPNSRTLKLFEKIAKRTPKPAATRLTFPSTKPQQEIDFIFCSPKKSWQVSRTAVIKETVASDHRPVSADLILRTR